MTTVTNFEVSKSELRQTRVIETELPDLGAGEVALEVDRFALTANNITYAAFGDAMQYWKFFPAEDGWGRVPVWGFANVVASNADGIDAGERVYGYFPMSSHLVIKAGKINPFGFADVAEHRSGLADIYNNYTRVAKDAAYKPETEAQQMLFRPLFTTSWLIDDMFGSDGYHGANTLILSSASSKTALALAHLAKERGGLKVVGLTSPRNVKFVEETGLYDQVVTYDSIGGGLNAAPSVYVDFAGTPATSAAVHQALGDDLKFSLIVGATDWDADRSQPPTDLPGAQPVFFFAPDQASVRVKEWGPEQFNAKVLTAQLGFYKIADAWMKPVDVNGSDAIKASFIDAVDGKIPADEGRILSI